MAQLIARIQHAYTRTLMVNTLYNDPNYNIIFDGETWFKKNPETNYPNITHGEDFADVFVVTALQKRDNSEFGGKWFRLYLLYYVTRESTRWLPLETFPTMMERLSNLICEAEDEKVTGDSTDVPFITLAIIAVLHHILKIVDTHCRRSKNEGDMPTAPLVNLLGFLKYADPDGQLDDPELAVIAAVMDPINHITDPFLYAFYPEFATKWESFAKKLQDELFGNADCGEVNKLCMQFGVELEVCAEAKAGTGVRDFIPTFDTTPIDPDVIIRRSSSLEADADCLDVGKPWAGRDLNFGESYGFPEQETTQRTTPFEILLDLETQELSKSVFDPRATFLLLCELFEEHANDIRCLPLYAKLRRTTGDRFIGDYRLARLEKAVCTRVIPTILRRTMDSVVGGSHVAALVEELKRINATLQDMTDIPESRVFYKAAAKFAFRVYRDMAAVETDKDKLAKARAAIHKEIKLPGYFEAKEAKMHVLVQAGSRIYMPQHHYDSDPLVSVFTWSQKFVESVEANLKHTQKAFGAVDSEAGQARLDRLNLLIKSGSYF